MGSGTDYRREWLRRRPPCAAARRGGRRHRVAGRDPEKLIDRWPGVDAVELDVTRPETIGPRRKRLDRVLPDPFDGGGRRAVRGAGPDRRHELRSSRRRERGGAGRLPRGPWRRRRARPLTPPGQPPRDRAAACGARTGGARAPGRHGDRGRERVVPDLDDLVRRLPAIITPRWVDTRSQPIAVDDVVTYLDGAREVTADGHHTIVEMEGADVLSYREMLQRLGKKRGVSLAPPSRAHALALFTLVRPRNLGSSFHREPADRGTAEQTIRETTRRRRSSPTSTRSASTRPSRGSAPSLPPRPRRAARTCTRGRPAGGCCR